MTLIGHHFRIWMGEKVAGKKERGDRWVDH